MYPVNLHNVICQISIKKGKKRLPNLIFYIHIVVFRKCAKVGAFIKSVSDKSGSNVMDSKIMGILQCVITVVTIKQPHILPITHPLKFTDKANTSLLTIPEEV